MKLIDGDKLAEMLRSETVPMTEYGKGIHDGFAFAIAQIETMEEAVRVGHWVDWSMLGELKFECSECDAISKRKWKFCPHCGARMEV